MPGKTEQTEEWENQKLLTFLDLHFIVAKMVIREFFRCKVKTSKKKFRSKVKAMKEWIKNNRIMPVGESD